MIDRFAKPIGRPQFACCQTILSFSADRNGQADPRLAGNAGSPGQHATIIELQCCYDFHLEGKISNSKYDSDFLKRAYPLV